MPKNPSVETSSTPRPVLTGPLRVAFVALATAAIVTPFLDRELASSVLVVAVLVCLTWASRMMITRSRNLPAEEHRAWRLFGLGLAIAAAGVATHAFVWLVASEVPVFGTVDLIWLVGYLTGITALALLPHASGSRWQRLRLLIDGVIGGVAVGALLWALVLRNLTTELRQAGAWEGLVGSAYVVLDAIILVVLMIVIVRRSTHRFDIRLMLIAGGAVAQALGDIAFLTSGLGRDFADAAPLYPLNLLAIGLFLAAAASVDRPPKEREYADRIRTPIWAIILPYGFAIVMVTLLVVRAPTGSFTSADAGLLHATVASGVLIMARQAVAIRENRRLVEDQRTALVASISHELRTPLTAVVGFLELLEARILKDKKERREVLAIANQQASYLSRIVSDLVMLASESISSMDLEITSTGLDELAWSAINTAEIDSSSVRVDAERDVIVVLDQVRMHQALTNFLANAVRYGGDRILVAARAEGGDLVVEVHDDGAGVPRKYELLIWEKFERGPNRLNATIPGSGIGLAVADAIAKAHGGAAGYRRSERLGGACFWIRLPGRVQSLAGEPPPPLTLVEAEDAAKTA